MFSATNIFSKRTFVLIHDLAATAAAIFATFWFRFENPGLVERLYDLLILLPGILIYAGLIYWYFDLYRSKWRFASLPDLRNIFRAATVMAASILLLDYILVSPNVLGTFFFGKITIVLYWLLQIAFLAGLRIVYRYFRDGLIRARNATGARTLILGNAADSEVLLRGIESGAIKNIQPLGILSPSLADLNQSLRGVRVIDHPKNLLLTIDNFGASGQNITRLLLTPSAFATGLGIEAAIVKARRLGIIVSRMPSLAESGDKIELAPIEVEDLLLRPSSSIDYNRLEHFIRGRSVIVTGGGGSIGSEICNRVATFGASRLLVIDNAEPALHAVLERLQKRGTALDIQGHICDVRDRERVFQLIRDYKPDLVFHAAALKHVPILEKDWIEGVRTNVFGSVNVADATVASGAAAMVMISTDKAVDPVSVLGATKRIAEIYCQAVDIEQATKVAARGPSTRIISVRFGNVLASNGSVVPKFKAQIEAGGPVTVTHPDMVRYFMTIREACDLVITSASHALGNLQSDLSVFVLNMGQPVKIVDLAERMIRLGGLEPGRDIEIVFSGLRPGERLREILFSNEEPTSEIGIPGVVAARPSQQSLHQIRSCLVALEQAIAERNRHAIFSELKRLSEKDCA
ncbi:SDR family NAD(P)-dependent oxidoreductase [Pseudolabrys sp.]|uniref:SDR family NAD(P)-dependent oxidoreductase n=1 Tax=Pseudolabrys sp. TaxID=1960880 RepID=UPI003D0F8451